MEDEESEEIFEPDGLSRSLKSGHYDTNYTVLLRYRSHDFVHVHAFSYVIHVHVHDVHVYIHVHSNIFLF